MHHKKIFLFLFLAMAFAAVHHLAVISYLYWYFWWFDIVMHFWGGLLIGLGVHTLTTFSSIKVKPTTGVMISVLVIVTGTWEVFEWFAGLYDPATYLNDTIQDVLVGFTGGLLAHFSLQRYTID